MSLLLDGRRVAAALPDGGGAEPVGPGGAARGEALLRGRRHRPRGHRRQRARSLAGGRGGGRRGGAPAHGRGVPRAVPVGEALRRRRDRGAVPSQEG